ncbi:B12-binding domain-containing radical SAM protein [Anaeromicropila populeti]|uniref:Radical SAM superfamily enzyme YgiQ, UPF0313 family n=1 Tax=Anaeromicropila populeti TaxID=37658 RepID=A0A1I6L1T3_9FIRM|nr:radical SAM protein [Anaeromicropila populeti]SFR97238.1 Radical SAM superfamily enzyme YgiQ, UPF0313 family [Anaeromicropila populeti]
MSKIHKIGTAIIIENSAGKILLQHRDKNPEIKYPNTWVLFGGGKEPEESPEEAIQRELMEELEFTLKDYEFYQNYHYVDEEEEHLQYIYYIKLDLDVNQLKLKEGDDLNYFSWSEIKQLSLGFNVSDILEDFFLKRTQISSEKVKNRKIKTILINLPIPFVEDDERQPPGGLVSIATFARSKGYDIDICDLSGNAPDNLLPLVEKADIYGIGTYSATYSLAVSLLTELKKKYPNALFVAGGPHASALPEQVAMDFDCAMCGEGENAWCEVIKAVENGQRPDRIIRAAVIEHLDELPFPDYESFCDMNKYTRQIDGIPVMCLDSSRGCNFRCRFCNSTVNKRGYWRARSAENVVEEVTWHYNNGWRAFRFNDDNFLADPKRAAKICELLEPLQIKWRIFARAESLNSELCKKLYDAGCTHISVGIESLSSEMLERMGKATSIERIKVGLTHAREAGIKTRGFFIVGFPGETDYTVEETIIQLEGLNLDEATVYPCLAYPGTDLFHRSEYYGITWIESDFSKYIQVGKEKSAGYVIKTKTFGPEEIQRWRMLLMNALKEKGINWCDESKEVV